MIKLDSLKIIDINKEDIANYLAVTNNTVILEQIKEKTDLFEQLLGHINQLMIRVNDILSKEKLDKFTLSLNKLKNNYDKLKEANNNNDKLVQLASFYQEELKYYEEIKVEILKSLTSVNINDYNNLVLVANKKIEELKSINVNSKDERNILTLYENIKNNIDSITNLHRLINLIDTLLLNGDNNKSKGNINNRKFLLFAKINDQIIKSLFKSKNDLVYACYTLEDNSKYYAIIKSEEEIKVIDQSFTNLPNLVLSKDNIIETCKIIINNATVYYNINEYMRYIEKSYRMRMTAEIDNLILEYKKRLEMFENIIKQQLDFIDEIALLVNNKTSLKYPDITYKDVGLEYYFKDYNKNLDSKTKEIERLIVEVLLNDSVKSEFDTSSILKVLYDKDILNDLVESSYDDIDNKPLVNTNDSIKVTLPLNKVSNNYEKLSNYLNSRVKELNLLKNSSKINVTITRDSDNLYKDINTVLDFHTAMVICDKVYKKGQGDYASCDYLKTGNTLKFTSKYGARELVNSIDRVNYLKLLLENIFKRYLSLQGKDVTLSNFINSFINDDNIKVDDIIKKLYDDEKILASFISNFDYDYLDYTSMKNMNVIKILSEKNSPTVVKIDNILEDIKKNNFNIC